MNATVETIDVDVEGIESIGQAAESVVKKVGQALAARQEVAPPAPAVPQANPMEMIQRALERNVSPEILDKLLTVQERWEASQARKAFDEAMAAAKAEIPVIAKNRTVDFTSTKGRTHYRHEDLAEIARTVNPILGRHGLSYRFRTTANINEPISVTCVVTHRLGYFEENTLIGPPDESGNKNRLQQVGSTLTYLQRMTLKAALGLAAAEDDDGKASGSQSDQPQGPVSEEQTEAIRKLAEEVGADLEKFCAYFKIESLPDLPAREFDRAMASLEKKRKAA